MWLGELWNPNREDKLPGRALYVGIILTFLTALIIHSPTIAFLISFTYGFWRTWAWGLFIGMGYHIPQRSFTKLEKFILKISKNKYDLAFLLRNLFMLPGFIIIGLFLSSWIPLLLGILLATIVTLSYKYTWKLESTSPIRDAELLSGAAWGITIGLLGFI